MKLWWSSTAGTVSDRWRVLKRQAGDVASQQVRAFVRSWQDQRIDFSEFTFAKSPGKALSVIVVLVLLLLFVISGISRCVRGPARDRADASLYLAVEPPE